MAKQVPVLDIAFEAASQLTVGSIVKLSGNNLVAATTAATDVPVGVVIENNGASAPFLAKVRVAGIAQVLSDGAGAIAAGDRIGLSATAGKAIKDASALGTINKKGILGIALNAVAATANLLCDVLIQPHVIPST